MQRVTDMLLDPRCTQVGAGLFCGGCGGWVADMLLDPRCTQHSVHSVGPLPSLPAAWVSVFLFWVRRGCRVSLCCTPPHPTHPMPCRRRFAACGWAC